MAICIDLGLKSYDITDTDGNTVGVIRFNPADVGLASRWTDVRNRIKALTEKTPSTPEEIGALDKELKAQIDYAFGTPVSGVLFNSVSSLAMCANGKLVLENVLEALEPIIRDAQTATAKASKARVDEYAAKYEKNKTTGLAPGQARRKK